MTTMLLYGSAFYSLMFLVTFPAYALLDETMSRTRSIQGFVEHSLACGMAVGPVAKVAQDMTVREHVWKVSRICFFIAFASNSRSLS
jgi:hypothetical protein